MWSPISQGCSALDFGVSCYFWLLWLSVVVVVALSIFFSWFFRPRGQQILSMRKANFPPLYTRKQPMEGTNGREIGQRMEQRRRGRRV